MLTIPSATIVRNVMAFEILCFRARWLSSKCNHDIFITFSQRWCSKINITYEFLSAIYVSASSYKLLYGCFQNMRRPKSALYSIYVIALLNNIHKKRKIAFETGSIYFSINVLGNETKREKYLMLNHHLFTHINVTVHCSRMM